MSDSDAYLKKLNIDLGDLDDLSDNQDNNSSNLSAYSENSNNNSRLLLLFNTSNIPLPDNWNRENNNEYDFNIIIV